MKLVLAKQIKEKTKTFFSLKKEKQFEEIKDEIEGEVENILEKLPKGTTPTESVGKI